MTHAEKEEIIPKDDWKQQEAEEEQRTIDEKRKREDTQRGMEEFMLTLANTTSNKAQKIEKQFVFLILVILRAKAQQKHVLLRCVDSMCTKHK